MVIWKRVTGAISILLSIAFILGVAGAQNIYLYILFFALLLFSGVGAFLPRNKSDGILLALNTGNALLGIFMPADRNVDFNIVLYTLWCLTGAFTAALSLGRRYGRYERAEGGTPRRWLLGFYVGFIVGSLATLILSIPYREKMAGKIAVVWSVLLIVAIGASLAAAIRAGLKKKTANNMEEESEQAARALLARTKRCTDAIHQAVTVEGFSCPYRQLMDILNQLIRLNEEKKVFMSPTPRYNLEKINHNVGKTVENFLYRAINALPSSGLEWADRVENLLSEMERDEVFRSILTPENRITMEQFRQRAAEVRQSEEKRRVRGAIENIGMATKNIDCSTMNPMEVILGIETNLRSLYEAYIYGNLGSGSGEEALLTFQRNCLAAKIPLMAEVRLASLVEEYRPKFQHTSPLCVVDHMEGHDFERWCAQLLARNHFNDIELTPPSGDQGVDIVAVKDEVHYAIQCKCYASDLGNTPVQEVFAGKEMYGCQVGVVMTNRYFTSGARALAEKTRVLLWDRDKLAGMLGA